MSWGRLERPKTSELQNNAVTQKRLTINFTFWPFGACAMTPIPSSSIRCLWQHKHPSADRTGSGIWHQPESILSQLTSNWVCGGYLQQLCEQSFLCFSCLSLLHSCSVFRDLSRQQFAHIKSELKNKKAIVTLWSFYYPNKQSLITILFMFTYKIYHPCLVDVKLTQRFVGSGSCFFLSNAHASCHKYKM